MRDGYAVLFILFAIIFMVSQVHAAGYGTSTVSIGNPSVNLSQGGSAVTSFTITLASGSMWGTSLSVTGAPAGMTYQSSPSIGDPTFSGQLTIYAGSSVAPGKYVLQVGATGDDPSSATVPLTVDVLASNSSVVSTPVKTPVQTPPFVYVLAAAVAMTALLSLLGAAYRKGFAARGLVASVFPIAIGLASSLYLLLYDSFLRQSAPLHYGILVVFFAGTSVLAYLIFFYRKKPVVKNLVGLLGVLTALFAVAMLVDLLFGLPLSSAYSTAPYSAEDYLLGFGVYAGSSVAVSTAFALLFLSSIVTAVMGILVYLLSGNQKKR